MLILSINNIYNSYVIFEPLNLLVFTFNAQLPEVNRTKVAAESAKYIQLKKDEVDDVL